MSLRCVAVLCVRNEALHLRRALEDLVNQGIDVAVIDHGSEDGTRQICAEFAGRGLVLLEDLPWRGEYDQTEQLQVKRSVIERLEYDWVIHADADEWMHTRVAGETLLEGIERLDSLGYNAVNFEEFVFLPAPRALGGPVDIKREFLSYYFFEPQANRLMRAWKKSAGLTNVDSGGHVLSGDALLMAPENFVLRHYVVLTQAQAVAKYSGRVFSAADLARGWHQNRLHLNPARLTLPEPSVLMRLAHWDSVELDRSRPRLRHFWDWPMAERGLTPEGRPLSSFPITEAG